MRAGSAETRLAGRTLAVVRTAWLLAFAIYLGLFVLALAPRYRELQQLAQRTMQTIDQQRLAPEPAIASWRFWLGLYPAGVLGLEIVVVLLFVLTALLIVWRRSDDWLAMFGAVTMVAYITRAAPPLDALAQEPGWHWPANGVQAVALAGVLILLWLFPSGRFVPRWTGPLSVVLVIWTVAGLVLPSTLFASNQPYAAPFTSFLALAFWYLLGLAAQFYRYRRVSDLAQRQQTKWIVAGISLALVCYAIYGIARPLLVAEPVSLPAILFELGGVPAFLASLVVIPFAFAFSMLRYRLWDIDLIINRALVYGGLTGTLVAVYAVSVVLLQGALRSVVGERSPLGIVGATICIAFLFQPLRQRIQADIDRAFYRRRYDAAQTLVAFTARTQAEVDLSALTDDLLQVVDQTVQPAHRSLWLRFPPPAAR